MLCTHTRARDFWKCKQSNRKSNKHFNPSHFVCIFVYVSIFIFVILPVSLILQGSTTVEPMAMLYFWPIVKNPGEWLSSSIKFSWYRGVAITPTHVRFGSVFVLFLARHPARSTNTRQSRTTPQRTMVPINGAKRCKMMKRNEKKERERDRKHNENTVRLET